MGAVVMPEGDLWLGPGDHPGAPPGRAPAGL